MLNVIFCKLYLWNSKYALTKGSAAEQTMYALALLMMTHLLSALFILAYLLGYSLKIIPIGLIVIVIMGAIGVFAFLLYRKFIKGKKYLLLCKETLLVNKKHFGLSHKSITLLYIGSSLFLFAIAMLLFIKENYPS